MVQIDDQYLPTYHISSYNMAHCDESYSIKLALIGNIDPYALSYKEFTFKEFPPVTMEMIKSYLIFRCSDETQKEIKAFKSLEAYKQLANKWIQYLGVKKITDKKLILGKVGYCLCICEQKTSLYFM